MRTMSPRQWLRPRRRPRPRRRAAAPRRLLPLRDRSGDCGPGGSGSRSGGDARSRPLRRPRHRRPAPRRSPLQRPLVPEGEAVHFRKSRDSAGAEGVDRRAQPRRARHARGAALRRGHGPAAVPPRGRDGAAAALLPQLVRGASRPSCQRSRCLPARRVRAARARRRRGAPGDPTIGARRAARRASRCGCRGPTCGCERSCSPMPCYASRRFARRISARTPAAVSAAV